MIKELMEAIKKVKHGDDHPVGSGNKRRYELKIILDSYSAVGLIDPFSNQYIKSLLILDDEDIEYLERKYSKRLSDELYEKVRDLAEEYDSVIPEGQKSIEINVVINP